MRIGIDIDDTLAEFMKSLLPWYNIQNKTAFSFQDMRAYELSTNLGISYERMLEVIDAFYATNFFGDLPPLVDALEVISSLPARHELIIITARPQKVKSLTEKWIGKNFGNRFTDIAFGNGYNGQAKENKIRMCRERGIDILVEDWHECAVEGVASGIETYLFDRPWNQAEELSKGMYRIHSWKEIGDRLSGGKI